MKNRRGKFYRPTPHNTVRYYTSTRFVRLKSEVGIVAKLTQISLIRTRLTGLPPAFSELLVV